MERCRGVFALRMLRRGSVLSLLLCLVASSLLPFSSAWPNKRSLIGSKCSQGVWMVKNGQLECSLCDKGQRWNRDEKYCENCRGRLTSCERNVLHSACSKTSCDDEGNATSTAQALPIPTRQPPTLTSGKEIDLTGMEPTPGAVTTGIPKSYMPGATTGSENPTDEQNKEDETNSHAEIRPVEDNSKSEKPDGLVIGFVVGGIIFLFMMVPIIRFIVKKHRSEPSSPRKSNAPEAQPGEPGSTDTLLSEDVHRVIET